MRGFRNEKKKVFGIFLCIVIVFCISACCTTRNTDSDVTDVISGNSYTAGQLEATVKSLDRTTSDSRERITAIIERSRGIENGIERLEYLFGEYESEVDRLLYEIDRIRAEIEIQGESDKHSDSDSDNIYRGENYSDFYKNQVRDKNTLLAESVALE